jgi:hypothetical protein
MNSIAGRSALIASEMYVAHGLVEGYRRGIQSGAIPDDMIPCEIEQMENIGRWVAPIVNAAYRITDDAWAGCSTTMFSIPATSGRSPRACTIAR